MPFARVLTFAIAAALALPLATAGTSIDPDVTDARGDASRPSADILSVWLETTPRGLKWTMKLASLPSVQPNHLYSFAFMIGLGSHSTGVGVDSDGKVVTAIDAQPNRWFQTADNSLLDARITTGTPAYVSAIIPFGSKSDLEDGSRIWNFAGRSAHHDSARGSWIAPADEARGGATNSYVVGGGAIFGDAIGAIVIGGMTIGGALAGRFAYRALARRAG